MSYYNQQVCRYLTLNYNFCVYQFFLWKKNPKNFLNVIWLKSEELKICGDLTEKNVHIIGSGIELSGLSIICLFGLDILSEPKVHIFMSFT